MDPAIWFIVIPFLFPFLGMAIVNPVESRHIGRKR